MFFYPYLCNIFRNLQDVQLLKQCKSMEELMKLTKHLPNIPSEDLAIIAQEGAKAAYNGGKKLGGYISDIIDAIFD